MTDKPNMHITHLQFSSFAGDSWGNLHSAAPEISKYINMHSHITLTWVKSSSQTQQP